MKSTITQGSIAIQEEITYPPINKRVIDEPLPMLTRARNMNVEEDFTKKAINKFLKNREITLKLPPPNIAGQHNNLNQSERSYSEDSGKNRSNMASTKLSNYDPRELK